jgi:hypothetical protein
MKQEIELRADQSDPRPLDPGQIIHGFASGAFGRDHYGCCRVESVGPDWVVGRDLESTALCFTSGRTALLLVIEARDRACPNGCDDYEESPLTTWGRK